PVIDVSAPWAIRLVIRGRGTTQAGRAGAVTLACRIGSSAMSSHDLGTVRGSALLLIMLLLRATRPPPPIATLAETWPGGITPRGVIDRPAGVSPGRVSGQCARRAAGDSRRAQAGRPRASRRCRR